MDGSDDPYEGFQSFPLFYALGGSEELNREWVLKYLAAWKERTACNGGITPDNIGLSGKIGENWMENGGEGTTVGDGRMVHSLF